MELEYQERKVRLERKLREARVCACACVLLCACVCTRSWGPRTWNALSTEQHLQLEHLSKGVRFESGNKAIGHSSLLHQEVVTSLHERWPCNKEEMRKTFLFYVLEPYCLRNNRYLRKTRGVL
jgi:hypothetical protein